MFIYRIIAIVYITLILSLNGENQPSKCVCYKPNSEHDKERPADNKCEIINHIIGELKFQDFDEHCVKGLETVIFVNTSIHKIEEGFFSNFTKMISLNMSQNQNIGPGIKDALYRINKKLEILKLDNITMNDEILLEIHTLALFPPSLHTLSLRENKLTTFPMQWIQQLTNLTSLDLSQSIHFRHIEVHDVNKSLPLTNLSVAFTGFFLKTLFKNESGDCVLPSLAYFNLERTFVNVSTIDVPDNCFQNLTHLIIKHSIFEDGLYRNSFRYLKNLKWLSLSETFNIYQLPVMNMSLKGLEMNNLQFNFYPSSQNLHIFGNLSSLEHLEIQSLNPGNWSDSSMSDLLSPLQNLKYLDASNNNLSFMPTVISTMSKLETLILSNNSIGVWHSIISGSQHTHLRTILLQNNEIEFVDVLYLPQNVTKLDLSGNPFLCTCDLVPFLIWVKENHLYTATLIKEWGTHYFCALPWNMRNLSLVKFNPKPTDCQPFNKYVITAMVLCCFMVLIVFVTNVVVCYKERTKKHNLKIRYKMKV